ncbi:MAG: hypothetical protein IJJ59_12995 [Pseudobutyrivibrio sp.]|uniref:hypothetical protein n=1 Tax=Pseudobutyrivibrio sp. TaxID=2014367 RepID=UPI0025F3FD6E|nr:hypothetical protein [Pseudobutyrivibrio sp.]MBQ6464235.1 hypothetical protein [Pseudobutyrivibrio sp.]
MRLKYYLRGIGIGIIFSTLLLTICLYFGKDSLAKETLSDAEIIKRATELGMVMTDEGLEENVGEDIPKDSSIESKDKSSMNSKENIIEEAVNESANESPKDSTAKEESSSEESASVEQQNTSEVTEEVKYVPFTVKGGESSEMVSKNLKKAGLIDSVDDFNKYLNKLNIDNLIQAGTFYVMEGSSYDDLAALLVNKDSRTTTPPKQD